MQVRIRGICYGAIISHSNYSSIYGPNYYVRYSQPVAIRVFHAKRKDFNIRWSNYLRSLFSG